MTLLDRSNRPGLDRPGFADPVHDAQSCFRAVLDALSNPGRICPVPAAPDAPAPLHPATAALLLTLLDADTSLFLHPDFTSARDWVAFHCGAPFAGPDAVMFWAGPGCPDLAILPAGSDDDPERGATVVVQLPSLTGGPALRLSGPGIDGAATFQPALPDDFARSWAANHALFPRGVDLVLCAGHELAALPRSTRVEPG